MRLYIGDVSKQDYLVLKEFAEKSNNILEFGQGASTQILSYYTSGIVDSLESDKKWIDTTKRNFDLLGIDQNKCNFIHSMDKISIPNKEYDFVFVDCIDHKRLEMALSSWPKLKSGGSIAFHDTRRSQDIKNFTSLINNVFNEIDNVEINYLNSNISFITKRQTPLYYENWNHKEGRFTCEVGYGNFDTRLLGKVGIAITTTINRYDYLNEIEPSFDHINYINCDTDKSGIAISKNNCIEKLYNKGVEYFFLFDDDINVNDVDSFINYCIRFHLETGIHHFSYQDVRHHNKIGETELFDIYDNCSGVFLFMTRECIDTIGFFNEKYDTYGYEHAGYSMRAFKAGLTDNKGPFITPKDLSKYLYANDFEYDSIESSLTNEDKKHFAVKNESVYQKEIESKKLYYKRK